MWLLHRFAAIFFQEFTSKIHMDLKWQLSYFFWHWFLSLLFFFPSSDQSDVKNDESNSSSIIFAEYTSEEEKSLESGIENQNNRLVNYTTKLLTRDANEFESSIEFQGNGLSGLSSRSVEIHPPRRLNSGLEENFTSTEESSEENLNLLGMTEVVDFPGTYQFDVYP